MMKTMQNKIYLITTIGCYACAIMNNIVKDFCKQHKPLEYYICDISMTPEFIITNVPLNDFPTIVLVKDNVIKYHTFGTMTMNELEELCKDLNFI